MAGSPSIDQIVAQIRTAIFGKDVRENIALGIEKCYEDATTGADSFLRNTLSVTPESSENLASPINAITSGMEWDKGVLKNSLTDSKNFFQLRIERISASGTITYIDGGDFNASGTKKCSTYCDSSTKYIQIRHNGTSRDLYARFPINLKHGTEVIISLSVDSTNPVAVKGISISDIMITTYDTSLWTSTIDSLHHLNIPSDAMPSFSLESNSTLFVTKIKINTNDAFTNIPDRGKTLTAAQIVSQLPNNATYSNNILRIEMSLTQALLYDFENNKMVVSTCSSSTMPLKNHLVLVTNYYGNIYGDWVNKTAYINQFLKPSIYIGNQKSFTYTKNNDNGAINIILSTGISYTPKSGVSVTISQQDIVSQLGSSAHIEGNDVVITIPRYSGLFLDATTGTLCIDIAGNVKVGYIPMLFNAWASIYGPLMDFYFRNNIEYIIANNDSLPLYYTDEINDTANKLSKLPTTNFNYLVFTDIHYSYPSEFTEPKLNYLMESINRLGNGANIDAVIFLGDIIEGGYAANRSESDNQINAVFEGLRNIRKPVLCAFGNHDNNMYDFSDSAAEPFRNIDHYITMNEWKNKAVLPFGIDSDFYYKDFPNKEMRVIVANTCDYRETVDQSGNVSIDDRVEIMIRKDQIDAIANMINDSPYDMIVFAHGLATSLFSLISIYNTRGIYTKQDGTTINFSGKTHKVLLYHTGHYHNSAMEYNDSYNVNVISTSCACIASTQQTLYSPNYTGIVTSWEDTGPVAWNERVIPRTKNTIDETCYDVVSVGNGKINKIGFGASNDGDLNI